MICETGIVILDRSFFSVGLIDTSLGIVSFM